MRWQSLRTPYSCDKMQSGSCIRIGGTEDIMVKLTAIDAVNVMGAISVIIKEKLPGRLSYILARIATKLNPEMEAIEKARAAIFEKYAVPMSSLSDDELAPGVARDPSNPEKMVVPVINMVEFARDIEDLYNTPIEINVNRIRPELFDGLSIEPEVIFILMAFVEDDD